MTNPKATDGDERFEPDWKQRLTLTVGTKSGDLMGNDDKVIQAAVDYVARLGGGTVQLLPGTFTIRNAVQLPSKIRLLGSGDDTVILVLRRKQSLCRPILTGTIRKLRSKNQVVSKSAMALR